MLKGLAITPPVVGRISIGRIVERNGKRLPERDDAFTLTTQVQQRGEWLLHPMQEVLRKATPGKLRSIPVRMLFADPDLNLRADFSLFDRDTGRPVCVGNGETCRRIGKDGNGIETLPCPSPDGCRFGQQGGCKPYARLNVVIGDEDEMGSFVLRTTSFNSIRTLAARLHYFKAISGNLLAGFTLELRLRGKSTTQSYRAPIYYVDLTVRSGSTLEEALTQAHELDARRKLAGFDQAALDDAARLGFANGAFEDSPEERAAVAEEFYPAAEAVQSNGDPTSSDPGSAAKSSLREKLHRQAAFLGGAAA
ncbi:recombination directionality factor [Burkholderia pseudomallei]|uniref:recombination directionality factor n=1 Tax=Burkholderia pseudomallei TaxID=28450 RepID=UPI0024694A07|nr:phage capsid protein [Burkholderia pseudomallei]